MAVRQPLAHLGDVARRFLDVLCRPSQAMINAGGRILSIVWTLVTRGASSHELPPFDPAYDHRDMGA